MWPHPRTTLTQRPRLDVRAPGEGGSSAMPDWSELLCDHRPMLRVRLSRDLLRGRRVVVGGQRLRRRTGRGQQELWEVAGGGGLTIDSLSDASCSSSTSPDHATWSHRPRRAAGSTEDGHLRSRVLVFYFMSANGSVPGDPHEHAARLASGCTRGTGSDPDAVPRRRPAGPRPPEVGAQGRPRDGRASTSPMGWKTSGRPADARLQLTVRSADGTRLRRHPAGRSRPGLNAR